MANKPKTKKPNNGLYIVTKNFSDDLPFNWKTLNRGERVTYLVGKYWALADAIKKRFPKVKIVDAMSTAIAIRLPPRSAKELKKEIETEFWCEVAEVVADTQAKLFELVQRRTAKLRKP